MVATTTPFYWPWIPLMPVPHPDFFTPDSEKDDNPAYDNAVARWCISSVIDTARNYYLSEYAANMAMVNNMTGAASWGNTEQVREFLGDQNNPTGRLALKYAIMQPSYTRLVGSASRLSISPKAISWSSNVAARLDAKLSERLLYAQAASLGGEIGQAVMKNTGVLPDEEAEEQRFRNLWTDPYERTMTRFLTSLSKHQDFEGMRRQVAGNISVSGVGSVYFFTNGNNVERMVCDPAEIGWDMRAKKPDFSDGMFCYWYPAMDVPAIAEQYQPSDDVLRALQKWANQSVPYSNVGSYAWPGGKYRVFKTQFKDFRTVERGYVLKDGQPHFCTINEKNDRRRDGEPLYTDKDLITPPENEFTVTWSNKEFREKKVRRKIQYLRFCDFIPWEYLPYTVTKETKVGTLEYREVMRDLRDQGMNFISNCGDLVLDHGCHPLQERDPDDIYGVSFTHKFASWMYVGNLPVAPLSCMRDIQSVVNATLSDQMLRLSRAEIPTTIFDQDALAAANITQEEAAANLKIGKAFGVGGMGMGVNQAITQTKNGLGPEFFDRFGMLNQLYQMNQNSSGLYDQNFGAPGGQDMLVRVKELQNQQAGIMLQPFMDTNESVFKQAHQFNASGSKLFYAQRPWLLNRLVGDEGEKVIIESQDFMNEAFRVEVVMSASPEQRREEARMMIMGQGGYLDRGFLDAQTASELLANGAMPEDVDEAAARYTKRVAEAQQAMQQDQAKQMAMVAAQQRMDALNEQEQQIGLEHAKLGLNADKAKLSAVKPIVSAQAKWLEPQENDFLHEQEEAGVQQ